MASFIELLRRNLKIEVTKHEEKKSHFLLSGLHNSVTIIYIQTFHLRRANRFQTFRFGVLNLDVITENCVSDFLFRS